MFCAMLSRTATFARHRARLEDKARGKQMDWYEERVSTGVQFGVNLLIFSKAFERMSQS